MPLRPSLHSSSPLVEVPFVISSIGSLSGPAPARHAGQWAHLGLPVWQADRRIVEANLPALPTGWPALDAELPGGGWPLAGLFELLGEPASGELLLLAPWLRALSRRAAGARELLWLSPPGRPCVSALSSLGLPTPGPVIVEPASVADAAWAAEQALRARSCAAVLWWTSAPVSTTTLRRLHLAAQAGATPCVALRPATLRETSSPAPLRLACRAEPDRRLAIEVFKRRGPPMAAPLMLSLPWPLSVRPGRHAADLARMEQPVRLDTALRPVADTRLPAKPGR